MQLVQRTFFHFLFLAFFFYFSLSHESTHDILAQALTACTCMEHRGASSADNVSGDGAGKKQRMKLFVLRVIGPLSFKISSSPCPELLQVSQSSMHLYPPQSSSILPHRCNDCHPLGALRRHGGSYQKSKQRRFLCMRCGYDFLTKVSI